MDFSSSLIHGIITFQNYIEYNFAYSQTLNFSTFAQIPMKTKNPERRITHLDLKFLDLSILSVDTKIPSDPSILKHRQPKQTHHLSNITRSNITKNYKNNDDTTDITVSEQVSFNNYHHPNKTKKQQEEQSQFMNYISPDLSEIRRQCEEKLVASNSLLGKSRTMNVMGAKSSNNQALEKEIEKYQRASKKIEAENSYIHKQIAKLYFTNEFQMRSKNRNISTMKIKYEKQNPAQNRRLKMGIPNILGKQFMKDHHHALNSTAMMQFNKYMAELQEQFTHKNKNGVSLQKPDKQRQKNYILDSKIKQSCPNNTGNISNRTNLNSSTHKKSDSSHEDKYLNFYENLYKDKRKHKQQQSNDKLINTYNSDSNQQSGINTNTNTNEQLENLRKKMITNNIDKNLEFFFMERKMRIPGLLKNFR